MLLSKATIPQWLVGSNVAFLTGRLGVSHIMPYIRRRLFVPKWHIRAPRHGFRCLMCFTCPTLLWKATIPQWPVGSNVAFVTGRLGVSHIMHIYQETIICPEITHHGPQTWFSMFNVFRVRQIAVKCSHSSVALWEYCGVPHWPVGSITHNVYIKRRLFVPK